MLFPTMVLIGALFTALGAFLTAFRSEREKVASAEAKAQLEAELRQRADEITELNKKLVVKAEEIAELNKTIAGSITGGDSFCEFKLMQIANSEAVGFLVFNRGKYPMYEVALRIVDADAVRTEGNATPAAREDALARLAAATVMVNIGTLAGNQAEFRERGLERLRGSRNLNVFITARNGTFTQIVRAKEVEGRWRTATRIVNDSDRSKPLHEVIDPAFSEECCWRNRLGRLIVSQSMPDFFDPPPDEI